MELYNRHHNLSRTFLSTYKETSCPLSLSTHRPRQPLFQSLQIFYFWMFYIHGSYNMCIFISCFLHWAWCIWSSSCFSMYQYFCCFLLPNSFPWYEYIFCLFIHQLIEIWILYTSGLLWIMLLWTFVNSLYRHIFLLLLGKYLGVECLYHTVTVCLTFKETAKSFLKLWHHFTFSTAIYDGVSLCHCWL